MDSEKKEFEEDVTLESRIKALEQKVEDLASSSTPSTPLLEDDFGDCKHHKCRERRERGSAKDVVRKHINDFLVNFSLPGFKYVGENGSERLIWVVVLMMSVMISSIYIREAYRKWEASPVLLSFNDSLTPVSLIPFPAITFCPSRRIANETALRQMLNDCINGEDCTTEKKLLLKAARLLCPRSISLNDSRIDDTSYDESVADKIDEISINCEDIIDWFKFSSDEYFEVNGNPINCSLNFQTLYIEGSAGAVCFSFNMLPAMEIFRAQVQFPMIDNTKLKSKPEWSPDSMLKLANQNATVPRYVSSNGRWSGLFIGVSNFTAVKNDTCGPPLTAAKIFFHNPTELPVFQLHESVDLLPHKELYLRVLPSLVTASRELNEYKPVNRRCYFCKDRYLALFQTYTQRNCQMECRTNCSLSLCGCVPFYLPRHNSSIEICKKEGLESCSPYLITGLIEERFKWKDVVMEYKHVLNENFQDTFRGFETVYGKGKNLTDEILNKTYPQCSCDCPPACTSIKYDIKVEEGETTPKLKAREFTRVAVSFKDVEFTSVVRKELIGLTDFIANSGGVLGVFTGFSFLAVCELLYYMTFKLWRTVKHGWDHDP